MTVLLHVHNTDVRNGGICTMHIRCKWHHRHQTLHQKSLNNFEMLNGPLATRLAGDDFGEASKLCSSQYSRVSPCTVEVSVNSLSQAFLSRPLWLFFTVPQPALP